MNTTKSSLLVWVVFHTLLPAVSGLCALFFFSADAAFHIALVLAALVWGLNMWFMAYWLAREHERAEYWRTYSHERMSRDGLYSTKWK